MKSLQLICGLPPSPINNLGYAYAQTPVCDTFELQLFPYRTSTIKFYTYFDNIKFWFKFSPFSNILLTQ